MRLTQLLESNETVWYHGTPDGQNFNGHFEQRTKNISYINNVKLWSELQTDLTNAEHGSDEYFKIVDQITKLTAYKTIKSPIFLSNSYQVANSYADDKRAFDYQAADPKVFKVTMNANADLTINAGGENFRGISEDNVTKSLRSAGISDCEINAAYAELQKSISTNFRMSTDALATISQIFGLDVVDVQKVKDSYNGTGPNATVRMVFNSELLTISK